MPTTGFIGLGAMGSALAANLVAAGHEVLAYDIAGPSRTPAGAATPHSVKAVAERGGTVVLSLPDGRASGQVAAELAACGAGRVTHVVDTSTIGIDAARSNAKVLADAGTGYVDAPVSGGVAGARARTLMIMVAGDPEACDRAAPVLGALSDRRLRVGDRAGMAQAVKLANNFLSATALAATSEAVSFACAVGVDMETMLEVLNKSSGQSAATSDKLPNHVLNGRYASGFTNTLMAKDVGLYVGEAEGQGTSSIIARVTAAIWSRFAAEMPGTDFTRIFPFVDGSGPADSE